MLLTKYSLTFIKKASFIAVNILSTGIQQQKQLLSDIEVIHKDVQGAFYHMRYPLADGSGTYRSCNDSSRNNAW